MKKLLLALLILVGSVLPSMAQDCDREWDYWANKSTKLLIEELINLNDLECLEYFVDVKGFDVNEVKMPEDESLINLVFSSTNAEPEILSFLISRGIALKDKDMDRIVLWMRFLYDDECDLFFRKFKILINEYPDAWKKICDDNVDLIVRAVTFAKDPVRAVNLLLENNLPLSEYDRYIKSAKKWVKEVKRDRRLSKEESTKWVAAGETLIALLEERKNVELQSMNENLQRVLNKINEEKWNKIEEETQNRYNYQF